MTKISPRGIEYQSADAWWVPVTITTLLAWPLGLYSAVRMHSWAREVGVSPSRYWLAFALGVALIVSAMVSIAVTTAT